MSDVKDNGGPAFPLQEAGPGTYEGAPGMTLRDYFAGQAMAAFISKIPAMESRGRDGCKHMPEEQIDAMRAGIAVSAYEVAEEMLAEKRKRENGGTE